MRESTCLLFILFLLLTSISSYAKEKTDVLRLYNDILTAIDYCEKSGSIDAKKAAKLESKWVTTNEKFILKTTDELSHQLLAKQGLGNDEFSKSLMAQFINNLNQSTISETQNRLSGKSKKDLEQYCYQLSDNLSNVKFDVKNIN